MWFKWSYCHNVVFVFVLIIVNIPDALTQYIEVPESPCPDVFTYRHNGTHYYGYGQLTNPPIGQDIVTSVNFIVQNELQGVSKKMNYYGKLVLLGGNQQIVDKIYSNQPVNFEVMLPTQNPLPLISSITVNNRVICKDTHLKLTNVTIKHTFKPNGLPPRPNKRPIGSFSSDEKGLTGQAQTTKPVYISPAPNVFVPTIKTTTTRRPAPVTNFNVGCGNARQSALSLDFGHSLVKKGDWPWLAAIHHSIGSSFSYRCAGTIISRKAILSAANCFFAKDKRIYAEDIIIFLGHYNLKQLQEEGSKAVTVNSIIIHPDYMAHSKLNSDIAIAKLNDTLEFSELIQPACLWPGRTDINDVVGQIGIVVGWPRDINRNTLEQRKVQLPIVPDANCLRSNKVFAKFKTNTTFCGGWRNGKDTPCQDDIGSGIMLNREGIWFIRGVMAFSLTDPETDSCNLFEFVVFTDVAKFYKWIEYNM